MLEADRYQAHPKKAVQRLLKPIVPLPVYKHCPFALRYYCSQTCIQVWSLEFLLTNMVFLKRKSTTSTQFFVQLTFLQDAFENGEDNYTLYLDFSKAFHRECHQILLKKLGIFGIGGTLLKLLSSFLRNWRQRVFVND